MIESVRDKLEARLDALLGLLPELLVALVVMALFVAVGGVAGAAAARALRATRRADRYVNLGRRLVRWLITGLGLVLALQILGLTAMATSLLATGGIVAIVFGFAFREIGENLLAGVFLAVSRSFEVGDLIESNDLRGVVREIDLRHVHVRTADGRDIFIPSSQIFKSPLINFTRDHLRRAEFSVGIDYRDDAQRARELLLEVVAGQPDVLERPAPAVDIQGFAANAVDLVAYFWLRTEPGRPSINAVRSAVMVAAREALAEAGFTFSSEVTTGVDVAPLTVRMNPEPESGTGPSR